MTRDLGHAEIGPSGPVVAGSYCTLRYTYTTGHPIDDSGGLRIVFRFAGDFGTPQFDDPSAPDYTHVETSGACRIEPGWSKKGHLRPWGQTLSLRVAGGFLERGDTIDVTFGDRRGGSPGWRMQTFCEETFEFKTLVDPIATCQFEELPVCPTIAVVPGPAARAVAIAPSQVPAARPFDVHLKIEDAWGNPIAAPTVVRQPGFDRPGIHRVRVADERTGLEAQSNPIRVTAGVEGPRACWADFHGQSEETIGTNSLSSYFAFARDYGLLDIAAHQGNDFQITDRLWEEINEQTAACYRAGSFVTFPGYEWSGNTPLGGDRNVYFASEGEAIYRSSFELLPDRRSRYPVAATASELFERLKDARGRPFAFAHVGGRYADLGMHDDDIEIAVEIHSAWGTFEWLAEEALRRGLRVGFCANSDGHKGRPGASYPGASRFGSLGGLTCVLADRLDREAVVEALLDRRFYATTGHRPLLELSLETGSGRRVPMGAVVDRGEQAPTLHVEVAGTAPIERIDVFNGSELLSTHRPYAEGDLGSRVKLLWSGARVRGRDRMVVWDGTLRVRGNRIAEAVPINFWNPSTPLTRSDERTLTWSSVTTGGASGCIVTLADARAGHLLVETAQGTVDCAVRDVDLAGKRWPLGGLDQAITTHRLPDRLDALEFGFALPLLTLSDGVNPIFVRVAQEDGHLAWSSPIYVRDCCSHARE